MDARIAIITASLAACLLIVASLGGALRGVHATLGLPTDFKARGALEVAPMVHSNLKIFALDDSGYAYLRKPYLTGNDWASILTAIGRAGPRAIVTTHMFGTGEFTDQDDLLSQSLQQLNQKGIPVFAGAFASPSRISFRTPLDLKDIPANMPKGEQPVLLKGWNFYGPDADYAHKFSGLGHLAYDGKARIPAYQKTEHAALPHLAIRTATSLGLPVPVTRDGYQTVNFPPYAQLAKATKSLKLLMSPEGNAWAEKLIGQGDVVLILSDMYTGKVHFTETPNGPLPSGYVVASGLNSALSRDYLTDASSDIRFVLFALALGVICGLCPGVRSFSILGVLGVLLIPLIGMLSFSTYGTVLPWVSCLLFFAAPGGAIFAQRTFRRMTLIKQKNLQIEKEKDKLNAVVRTAQMFAHDVRKPFSMLNMATQSLHRFSDGAQIVSFVNRFLPELERAMSTVEDMIHDIMEIDSHGKINKEPTHPGDFLTECVQDTLKACGHPQTTVVFDFQHTKGVDIDRSKVRRVVTNIVDNAIAAMNQRGTLTIRTSDVHVSGEILIEVAIHNTNSRIPPDKLDRVFEAFYTAGKKGGTGLGLAIAQKVIAEHGGSITARSDGPQSFSGDLSAHWTEFAFTLPASTKPLAQGLAQEAEAEDHPASGEDLQAACARLGRPVRVLVIDDEAVYLESMQAILSAGPFAGQTIVQVASNHKDALAAAQSSKPDVVLCDIDMGAGQPNGFDIVADLRSTGCAATIIMHSNRVFSDDSGRSQQAGADHFMPKPVKELKLLSILSATMAAKPTPTNPTNPNLKDVVVVLDDDVFTCEAWTLLLEGVEVKTFESPTVFWNFLAANKPFINDIKLIVTDFYFDNDPNETGESFARRIKEIGNIPVLLSSNASFTDVPDVFDAVIGKEPETWEGLQMKAGTRKAS